MYDYVAEFRRRVIALGKLKTLTPFVSEKGIEMYRQIPKMYSTKQLRSIVNRKTMKRDPFTKTLPMNYGGISRTNKIRDSFHGGHYNDINIDNYY